jgi:hypothetical protein
MRLLPLSMKRPRLSLAFLAPRHGQQEFSDDRSTNDQKREMSRSVRGRMALMLAPVRRELLFVGELPPSPRYGRWRVRNAGIPSDRFFLPNAICRTPCI